MNRQILFKAKRLDNGEWVEGYYLNVAKINHFICTGKIKLDGAVKGIIAPEMYAIDPNTLCQYTGLNDNTKWEDLTESEKELFLSNWNYQEDRKNKVEDWNGRKIWENDIVRCGTKLRVSWNHFKASWVLSKKGWMYNHFFGEAVEPEDVEVIGNIFDNPELLEVEEC